MTTRAHRIEALFHAALELSGEERARFLARSCHGDSSLRGEVEGLLALDERPDERLDRSAPAILGLEPRRAGRLVGQRLGPYLLGRCLGTGGMGAVYEATQENPQRTVAVKILREDVTTPELARRFDVEATLLARLQHPGIAHVYGAGVAELEGACVPWIAMERVEGALTITEWARAQELDLAARLELFTHVCAAVHHGHQRGVIHRDIKPGNVLIDAEGRPKLIDFGVARAIDPEGVTHRTEAGVFLGTVQYMSPEQCVDAGDLDVRSDVYSLGVLLFELLCGAPPHDLTGVPLPEAARIVRDEAPRRPATLLRAAQGDLETILLTALAKDRERRYPSALELAADVQRYLANEPIQARVPSLRYRALLFARRQKVLVGSLVAIFLMALGAAAVSLRFALAEQRARVREERSSMLANLAAADLLLGSHDVEGARHHLEQIPSLRRGWEWRYLVGCLDSAASVLAGPGARCEAVAWRAERIASAWHYPERKRIVLWDALSGQALAETSELDSVPTRLALAPDGAVLWGGNDGSLRRWDPVSGGEQRLGSAHSDHVTAIEVAREVAYTASADGSVRAWNLAGGGSSLLFSGAVPLRDLALAQGPARLALAGEDGLVHLLQLSSRAGAPGHGDTAARGTLEPVLLEPLAFRNNGSVLAVAFAPAGDVLAVGTSDGALIVIELETRRELLRSTAHAGAVLDLAFLADGRLVSVSADRTVRVWDVRAGLERAVLHGHTAQVKCLAVDPGGARFASGAYDGTLRLWNPDQGAGGLRIAEHQAPARAAAFSPDGRTLALALLDGTARLVDAASGELRQVLIGHTDRLTSLAFEPDGARLASASNDGTVRLWELASATCIAELDGFAGGVLSIDFAASPRGLILVSGVRDGTIALHDAQSFTLLEERNVQEAVDQLDADPAGRRLVVATDTPSLLLLDLPGLALRWRVALDVPVHGVAFSPDGRTIATGEGAYDGSGQRARLWDAVTGAELRSFVGHGDVVIAVCFSPDGERLVTGSADETLRLWDPRTADPLLTLRDLTGWVWSAAFSPDGSRLVASSGNPDRSAVGAEVRLWDTGR